MSHGVLALKGELAVVVLKHAEPSGSLLSEMPDASLGVNELESSLSLIDFPIVP